MHICPVINDPEKFAEEPAQDPVHHKARCVRDQDRGLAQKPGERTGRGDADVVVAFGADDFHQRQHRHWIEEVQSHHAFRIGQAAADCCHGKGRGVRQQQRISAQQGLYLGEDGAFDAQLLEHGLDDHVAVPEFALVHRSADKTAKFPRRRFSELPAPNQLVQVPGDPAKGTVHPCLGQIGDQDRNPQLPGEEHGKLTGHEPGSDYSNAADRARDGAGRAQRPLPFGGQESLRVRAGRLSGASGGSCAGPRERGSFNDIVRNHVFVLS